MKRWLLRCRFRWVMALLTIAMLVSCGRLPAVSDTSRATASSIRGKIIDSGTASGIANALVQMLYGAARTATLTDGTFSLSGLPGGAVRLAVTAAGYEPRIVDLQRREQPQVIALTRRSWLLAYELLAKLYSGRLDGSGRIAVAEDRILLTARAGRAGALLQLDPLTGEAQDKISRIGPLSWLPSSLADVTTNRYGAIYLLEEQGRLHLFSADGQHRMSRQIAAGPGVLACNGSVLFVAETGKIQVLDFQLSSLNEWRFPALLPTGIALDQMGNLFIAADNGEVLEYDADGRMIGSWQDARLPAIGGIAIDSTGQVFATDPVNHQISVLAATGQLVGSFGSDELQIPKGIAINDAGVIYVADSGRRTVFCFKRKNNSASLATTKPWQNQ
ncbi:MAG: carboxypeptidase regulatory-like domain-containing protein [Cyanobacteria bacterium NC_groundwater_1444_Ag_S-0.65um_54_12]|nr:carboxypeptidase regulatory-like domain-containing protein [Cyanobacteria bacterium NC_groundwater_1444_Ag_S-0.65um_54_12]